jgi:hypothetical protein
MTGENKKNYLEMSDEEFLALPEAATGLPKEEAQVVEESQVKQEETPAEVVVTPNEGDTKSEVIDEKSVDSSHPEASKKSEEKPDDEVIKAAEEAGKKEGDTGDKSKDALIDNDASGKEKTDAEETPKEPDYKALYEQITAPLKANGKTIEIKGPEDVLRLMQMGAGFGRKMQDIQPHLKTLRFMEQNNLLNADQAELAFLIDLKNKNPDAIKKLVKDSGIDPLDFQSEEQVNYHTNITPVTDQQVVFQEALDNLKHRDGGPELLNEMANNWDAPSHGALMNDPNLLDVIHQQKQSGVYDRIVSEMDRQKALGNLPHSTPFLQAYKQVGDHIQSTNGFADLIEKTRQVPVKQEPQIIDTKVAAPKPVVSNNDKAKAAAATKTTPKKTAPVINPLAMSDEDFAKQYGNFVG